MTEPVFYSDIRGRNLFGIRVEGDDMMPLFRNGDIAIINPNLQPRNGDYVVARKGSLCMLRLFVEGPDGAVLVAPGVDHVPMPAGSSILLGRVVERRRSYKERDRGWR